jgi:hypothetical protein
MCHVMVLFHVMVDDCSSTLLVRWRGMDRYGRQEEAPGDPDPLLHRLRAYMRGPRRSVVPGECPEPACNFSCAASVFIRMTLRAGNGGVPGSLAFAWDGSVGGIGAAIDKLLIACRSFASLRSSF